MKIPLKIDQEHQEQEFIITILQAQTYLGKLSESLRGGFILNRFPLGIVYNTYVTALDEVIEELQKARDAAQHLKQIAVQATKADKT